MIWILIICGGWMLALVLGLALVDAWGWWQGRQEQNRIVERLRALGRWRRAQSRLSAWDRPDSPQGAARRKLQR